MKTCMHSIGTISYTLLCSVHALCRGVSSLSSIQFKGFNLLCTHQYTNICIYIYMYECLKSYMLSCVFFSNICFNDLLICPHLLLNAFLSVYTGTSAATTPRRIM
jgi:hypothetical protein